MTDCFKCQRCGSDTLMQLQITISAPSSFYGNLSKTNLRKKECRIVGVKWETADYICTNHECRYVAKGYGDYVINLQKENKQLKTMLEQFQNMAQVSSD